MSELSQLDSVLRKLALTIGVVAGLAVPAGFGIADYSGWKNILHHQAEDAAERVEKYAYATGDAWHYSRGRLAELIDSSRHDHGPTLRALKAKNGEVLATAGAAIEKPRLTARVPVIVSEETVGHVAVTSSAEPFLARLAGFVLAGIVLAFMVYGCVHHLPLRALRRVLKDLIDTQNDLREQVGKTSKALALAEMEQHRAEQASRAKSEFLANMSHELRTPLNAILGFSGLMESGLHGPLNEHYSDYIRHISQSGQNLLRIVNDILDIAKIDAGQLQADIEPLDAASMVESCVGLLRPQAEVAQLALRFQAPVRMDCRVIADSRRMKQALLHLMSNAVKFTPPEGEIMVMMAARKPGMIDVIIQDTGIGMTDKQIAMAFQPFSQVDGSLSRKYEGTGLGLALAKRLTELQGGELILESIIGVGTTVTLRMPAADLSQVHSLPPKKRRFPRVWPKNAAVA
jgi:signal transduction histidine kinase